MTSATAHGSNQGGNAGATMAAIVHETYGQSPDHVLGVAEVATPTIGNGEVLVRVSVFVASIVVRGM